MQIALHVTPVYDLTVNDFQNTFNKIRLIRFRFLLRFLFRFLHPYRLRVRVGVGLRVTALALLGVVLFDPFIVLKHEQASLSTI